MFNQKKRNKYMNYTKEEQILRTLTAQYAECAADPKNLKALNLHRSVNDLKQVRPIVLIDEVPWNEMNHDGSLTLKCENPTLRRYEGILRRKLYQWKYFPADMVLEPYIGVRKKIHSTGIGVEIQEEIRVTEAENHVVSHKYHSQFETEEDLLKLHSPVIEYDESGTEEEFEKIGEVVGDLIPVKKVGEATGYGLGCKSWDIIASCMDLDTLLYNLIDEPEYMHALAEKLADIFIDTIHQYERLNLLDADALYVHSTAATISGLEPVDREHVKAGNVWGRGLAQILSTVSPEMHEEFDITYMKKAMAPFGAVYYGCCEPLDKKIDILRQIPHLRKISISPWADINVAAEAIEKEYVASVKPNPANVAFGLLDEQLIRSELQTIINACDRHGCAYEIVLKDISTVKHHPENLMKWEKIAMELVGG